MELFVYLWRIHNATEREPHMSSMAPRDRSFNTSACRMGGISRTYVCKLVLGLYMTFFVYQSVFRFYYDHRGNKSSAMDLLGKAHMVPHGIASHTCVFHTPIKPHKFYHMFPFCCHMVQFSYVSHRSMSALSSLDKVCKDHHDTLIGIHVRDN